MKYRLFLIAVLLILTVFHSYGYDIGGAIDNATALCHADELSISQRDKLSLWFGAGMGKDIDIFIQGSYTFSLERYYLFNLDSLKIDFRVLPFFNFTFGRINFSEFSGKILNHTADGIMLDVYLPFATISSSLGLLEYMLHPASSIIISKADAADTPDENVIFAPPRIIGYVTVEFPDLLLQQSLCLAFLFQEDHREDVISAGETDPVPETGALSGKLHTQYLGIGVYGQIIPSLYYDSYAYLGTGSMLSYIADSASATSFSYQYKPVLSFLGGGGIRYYMDKLLFSSVSLSGFYSSGDADHSSFIEGNTSGSSTAFIPISRPSFGVAFSPQIGNLFMFELNYSIKPFSWTGLAVLNNLQTAIKAMTFFRSTTGHISEAGLNPDSDSLYLGTEADFIINFRPFSDLGFALCSGVFIPGNAFPEDQAVKILTRLELSFSF